MAPAKTPASSRKARKALDEDEETIQEEEAPVRSSKKMKFEEKDEASNEASTRKAKGKNEAQAAKLLAKEVAQPSQQAGAADSDDDAPEEVSMSVAKQEAHAAAKAEGESRRALNEKRKAANRAKEASIAKAKDEASARSLSADILSAVVEEDSTRKEREEEEENRQRIQEMKKVIKLSGEKKVMKKQGFVLQKLKSSILPAAK
jgi:hypothetical protein